MSTPRTPDQASPPASLRRAKSEAARDPVVARTGLTTTPEGTWALKIWLRRDAHATASEVESLGGGHPVVVVEEPSHLPIARPAYPRLGE